MLLLLLFLLLLLLLLSKCVKILKGMSIESNEDIHKADSRQGVQFCGPGWLVSANQAVVRTAQPSRGTVRKMFYW